MPDVVEFIETPEQEHTRQESEYYRYLMSNQEGWFQSEETWHWVHDYRERNGITR